MTRADKIRSMTDDEMAKSRVLCENDTIDGEAIPGSYSYYTSYGVSFPSRKQAEEAELRYLQEEVE